MDKNFRYAVFLSLFFGWDADLYRKHFDSNYTSPKRDSPMSEVVTVIGHDRAQEGYAFADQLMSNPPKVVE